MADRSVAVGDTLNKLRFEFNGTAEDVGDIQNILDATGYIASSTDLAEAIVALNTELPEIKQDSFIFPGRVMAFEGATDDSFETTITFTEPTADRTHTLPDNTGTIMLADTTDTSTNKTFTSPKNSSPVPAARPIVIIADPGKAKATGNPSPSAVIIIINSRIKK